MWSVGISVSPCTDATRMGYDLRQINRIVIRVAQYCLNHNMRVIFGHDWREDGVMRAIADFANKVASGSRGFTQTSDRLCSGYPEDGEEPRMLNVVPTGQAPLSRAAREAELESGGILKVLVANEAIETPLVPVAEPIFPHLEERREKLRATELTNFRLYITTLLDPGCRICLGGRTNGYEGNEPGVMEEARLALVYNKPLYLLGGFGGATRSFGEDDNYGSVQYWQKSNGLVDKEKQELFETTDIERVLRLVSIGIKESGNHM